MIAFAACPLHAEEPEKSSQPTLEQQFRDPPASVRPRVWWHWMNGNISKPGIAADLAWMKRVGIGGMQNFDANLQTPQIVEKRLIYMTPEWKDAFRFAAREADRLGLELAVAASPGWSETGGPWVKPEDGMKKLVWSEMLIEGGRPFSGKPIIAPMVTGPFQSIKKDGTSGPQTLSNAIGGTPEAAGDIAVLAWPENQSLAETISTRDLSGQSIDKAGLVDEDPTTGVTIPKTSGDAPAGLEYVFAKAQTVEAARIFAPGVSLTARLEASNDGMQWQKIADFPSGRLPTTLSFAAVSASRFRVRFVKAERSGSGGGFNMSPAPGVDMSGMMSLMAGMGRAQSTPRIAEFRLYAEPRVDKSETKAGFAIVPNFLALSQGLPDAKGIDPSNIIDLTGRLRADGTLDWTPPKGRWHVLRLGWSLTGATNHPASSEATGLEVDKYDGAAVRRYLEHYIGMYRDAVGTELVGKRGLHALLTDSIETGPSNWTPQLIAQFARLRGYDPMPWLPALTGVVIGSRAESDRFLYDFRRTLADLLASEHYGVVAKVAHENDLKVYGEALEDRRPVLGDDMAMRRYADYPMAAMWAHSRDGGPGPTYVADIKGAASVANIYGQNIVAAESLTSALAPWAFAPADLKRTIDLEFILGVNRPVIHTSVHVPLEDKKPGLSLFLAGQYFNRNESWAEMARPWMDYVARNSLMLQQGRSVAAVAYFYGEEAPITGLFGTGPIVGAPKNVGYDFVNADALADALSNEGSELVSRGGARYRVLYLGGSSKNMTLATLERIAELVEGGATVIGQKPEADPGRSADPAPWNAIVAKLWPGGEVANIGKGRVIALSDIEVALKTAGVSPDFRAFSYVADTDIRFNHRRLPDGDSYFISNRKDRVETIEGRFRVTGKVPELWDPETGKVQAVSYHNVGDETMVPLTLLADQSVHVVFRKPADRASRTIATIALAELARIDGPWKVDFQTGRGAPASAEFASLVPLNENTDPGIKYFSGIATYSKQIETPRGWKHGQLLWLDLGEVKELAEIFVNGKPAGTAWHAPWRVDIGSAARKGRNRIEIRVANLWVNRLVGDAQPGAQKVTWTALATYKADAPLRRSGLIGPVRLLGEVMPPPTAQ